MFVLYGECIYVDPDESANRIWKRGNTYIINFIHGSSDGYLFLKVGCTSQVVNLTGIRKFISGKIKKSLPISTKIIILPCHPAKVKELWKDLIKFCNFEVLGDWEETTWDTTLRSEKNIIIIGKKEELDSIPVEAIVQAAEIEKRFFEEENTKIKFPSQVVHKYWPIFNKFIVRISIFEIKNKLFHGKWDRCTTR